MSRKKIHNSCYEAESYLKNAQDIISRSFHELAAAGINEVHSPSLKSSFLSRSLSASASSLNRRKSAAELYSLSGERGVQNAQQVHHLQRARSDAAQSLFSVNVFEDQRAPRRKRFTRRQKHRRSEHSSRERASKSTSALNRTAPSSSSSDEDIAPRNLRSNRQRTPRKPDHELSWEDSDDEDEPTFSVRVYPRFPSSSNLLTTSQVNSCSSSQGFQKSRGPSARKAQRRVAAVKLSCASERLRPNQAISYARLNSIRNDEQKPIVPVRRSLSVKDLNGKMVDFSNQDSVTRWTSQILAEIDSLPSSCINLNSLDNSKAFKRGSMDRFNNSTVNSNYVINLDNPFSSHFSFNDNFEPYAPPIPSHRTPLRRNYVTNNILAPSEVMFSSYSTTVSELMTSSTVSSNPMNASWETVGNPTNTSMQSSAQASIPVANTVGSNEDEGTPRVLTPLPTEEVWGGVARRSVGIQGDLSSVIVCEHAMSSLSIHESVATETKKRHYDVPTLTSHITECASDFDFVAKPSVRTAQHTSAVIVSSNSSPSAAIQSSATGKPLSQISRLRRLFPKRRIKEENSDVKFCGSQAEEVLKGREQCEENAERRSAQNKDIDEAEKKMNASIARLTQSVYGNLSTEKHGSASSQTHESHSPIYGKLGSSHYKRCDALDACTNLRKSADSCEFPIAKNGALKVCREKATSPLTIWKKKAERRALQAVEGTPGEPFSNHFSSRDGNSSQEKNENRRSVHGIVASLIRAAEETRFHAPDKPSSLSTPKSETTSAPQEACTQTSPFSLSRSSSFDWINEPADPVEFSPKLNKAELPQQLCRPHTQLQLRHLGVSRPVSSGQIGHVLVPELTTTQIQSLHKAVPCTSREGELDRIADQQVQEMLHRSEIIRRKVMEEQQMRANIGDIDKSIAMLLGYAEDLTSSSDIIAVSSHYSADRTFDQSSNRCLRKGQSDESSSPQCISSPTFSSRAAVVLTEKMASDSLPNEYLRRCSSQALAGNESNACASTPSVMSDSIYDNVHGLRRHAIVKASERSASNSNESLPSPVATRQCFMRGQTDRQYTVLCESKKMGPPRDASVSSGLLADSESSPTSPTAQFIDEKSVERKPSDRKSTSCSVKRRSKIAPVEINSSFCAELANITGGPSSPPPPSPLSTAVRPRKSIAASELFIFGGRLSDKAGSCEQLDADPRERMDDELLSMKKLKAEEEAIECCNWLRDAGFPQYARLYEEHQFPIDIHSVQRDHEFLDTDSLKALFRRLHALNRCAIMKVENVVLRKRSYRFDSNQIDSDIEDEMIGSGYDDEEDQVAISNRWRYQRKSQTWSRIAGEDIYANSYGAPFPKKEVIKMSKMDRNARARPEAGAAKNTESKWRLGRGFSQDSPKAHDDLIHEAVADCGSSAVSSVVQEDGRQKKSSRGLQRSQSERIKERARALMKRMDIRSSSRRRKNRQPTNGHDLVIGEPVLVSHFSASPRTMRMYPDGLASALSSHSSAVTSSNGRYPSEADGAAFAVLQPGLQRGPVSSNFYSNSCDPCIHAATNLAIRSKPSSMSKRRMGVIILPPTSDSSSTDDSLHNSRYRINSNRRPRDLSCDPAMIRGYSRRECETSNSRIYDRVALDDAVFPITRVSRRPDGLPDFDINDRFSATNRKSQSTKPSDAASRSRKGGLVAGKTASASSLNRNGVSSGIHITNTPSSNADRRANASEGAHTVYNLSERCRLVVNADGYYEHISDVASSSPEATATRQMSAKPAHQSMCSLQRAMSPASTSSTASTSNVASRLKVDVDVPSKLANSSVSPNSVVLANSAQRSHSSLESSGNDDETRHDVLASGERRDSGVGSSLSRSPSGPTTQRQRNSILAPKMLSSNSLSARDSRRKAMISSATSNAGARADEPETFLSDVDLPHCMDALSVCEMQRLRKMAFLKLSVLMERYAGGGVRIGSSGATSNGGNVKNWAMQKLMRRIRSPDLKPIKADVSIFGLPLAVVQGRTGFALPRSVLEIMRFLRSVAPDTIGIFRKNGVRSRIAELRSLCDVDPEQEAFVEGRGLDPLQVHDVADMLKQYFRELPEPLMTAKYSDAFANIYLYVPEDLRIEALQYAVLLLPDENREALQTLLYFLHDVAKHSLTNNMNAQNLAVCFAPSLFHLSASRLNTISPTRRHKTIGAAGMPTEQEIKESRAAQECLVQMIQECSKLFIVPSGQSFENDAESNGYEPDAPYLTELGVSVEGNYKTYLQQKTRELIKEHRDRWKGWIVEGAVDGVEISSKKSPDGHPLRYFRVWVDVEAPPKEILTRLIRERNLWDSHTINWRTVASLSTENCDVFQYVINDTPSHPTRDAMVVRLWRADVKELRGGCVLVERSVHSSETQLLGGIPAAVLASRFLVEPNAGRSRVTYVSRIDLRGRSNTWYGKVYGQLVARQMAALRDSFKQVNHDDEGPETKV